MAKREKKEPTVEEFMIELRENVMIDKDDLDTMWVQQPQLFQRLGERIALEISIRDEAKEELKDITAELDGEIREDDAAAVERDGKKKMTETAIANIVREDKKFKVATARLAELNLGLAKLQATKETYLMRKSALQDLVSLHISGYSMSTSSKPSRDAKHDTARKDLHAERKRRLAEED